MTNNLQRNHAVKRPIKKGKRRAGTKPNYYARKSEMTLEEQRRECELMFLKKIPKMIPKPLFVECRTLFKRRAETLATDEQRYAHDVARRKAIQNLIHERVKKEFDFPIHETRWATMTQVDRASWKEKEAEQVSYIIKELEFKTSPQYVGFGITSEGYMALYRDFLHTTLCLPDQGGIPDRAIRWLKFCLARKFMHKNREVSLALDYIAACRRHAGINHKFDKTMQHKGITIGVDVDWSKEQMEKEVEELREATLEKFEDEGDEHEEDHIAARLADHEHGMNEMESAEESNDEDEGEGGVSLRLLDADGEIMAPEPILAEDSMAWDDHSVDE